MGRKKHSIKLEIAANSERTAAEQGEQPEQPYILRIEGKRVDNRELENSLITYCRIEYPGLFDNLKGSG